VFVVEEKGEIIAYAAFGFIWNLLHFEDCYVEPEHRRKGIATRLLLKRMGVAKRLGMKKVISDCDVGNKPAIRYHLKNGFKKCGYVEDYWDDEDSYVFSKEIK
jgi:phosphinothricin acetyltransferase